MSDFTTGTVPEVEAEKVELRNALIKVKQDSAHMKAEMEIEPPQGGGLDATRKQIEEKLKADGVIFGLVEEGIAKLALPTYNERILVAEGKALENGENAVCEEKYPREKIAELAEREDGSVNYRELSLITDVPLGTVICEITKETEGKSGMNVLGIELKQKMGKPAIVQVGEGTSLSADKLRLESNVSGNLVFRGGRFCVDSVFKVENIDFEIGNITFSGDVVVKGDIQDGFEIHAGGNVTMCGRVGSVVIVGKNIKLEQGINGTGRAVVEAKETIEAGFIENSNISAGKHIKATSIINSKIECEGDVDVTSKHGLICGGKITVFGSVKATTVGNEFNTLTNITLGVTPRLLEERKKIMGQLADVEKHIAEMTKNIEYIERLVADGRAVPLDRVQILQRTQIQLPMSEKKRDQLKKKIEDLEEKMSGVHNAMLTAKTIYPPTKVTIGAVSTNCIETKTNCRVYKNAEGEIVFGSM